MAVADWIIVAVLAVFALQAARHGILVEVFSLAGIVVGVGVASWNYTRLLPWFARWLHPEALAHAASFLAIALGVMLAASLAGRLLRWTAGSIGLGWADRLLGALFGLVKGAVLVTLGIMLLAAFWPGSAWQNSLRASRLAPYFVAAAQGGTVGTPSALRAKVLYGVRLLHDRSAALLGP